MHKKTKLMFAFTAVVFNNWLLGLIFNHRLLFTGGSISELSADTQPHRWLFRVLDIFAGLLFLICAYLIAKKGRDKRFIACVVAVIGIAEVVDALMAMPCSGTLSPSCVVPVRLSPANFYLPPHTYSSTVLGICFLVLPILGYIFSKTLQVRFFKQFSLITIIITLVFFGLLLNASDSGYFTASAAAGYSQELQMLAFGLWFMSLSIVYWPAGSAGRSLKVWQKRKNPPELTASE